MARSVLIEYEWDTANASANLEKHGVSFERVLELDWEKAVTFEDTRRQYGEQRFISYVSLEDRLYSLCTRHAARAAA